MMDARTTFLNKLGFCTLAATALLLMSATAHAQVEKEDPRLDDTLSRTRWSEQSTGLSMRPPLQSKISQQVGDKATLIAAPRYQIKVYVKKSAKKLNLRELQKSAVHQVGIAEPSSKVLYDKPRTFDKKNGFLGYFLIPGKTKKDSPWIMGQAIVMSDNNTVVIIRLETDQKGADSVRLVFEKMLTTIRFQDMKQIIARRKTLSENAVAWHKTVTAKKRHEVLIPSRLMRVMQDGEDVGWIIIREERIDEKAAKLLSRTPGQAIDKPGVMVKVQGRVILGGKKALDTLSEFFVSDDNSNETWRIKTTVRPLSGKTIRVARPLQGNTSKPRNVADNRKPENVKKELPNVFDALEVGVRNYDEIVISRETPDGVKNLAWRTPSGKAGHYLPQVDLFLIGRLLPAKETELGYYAYYPSEGRLTFRTERVETQRGGGLTVHSRPSPDQQQQVTRFDRTGRLLQRTLPSGQQVVPTTETRLRAIWKLPPSMRNR